VQALAGEARAVLVSVAPSDILSKFVGESESSVRRTFREAVDKASRLPSKCAIVFFDELDALGRSRQDMGQGEGEGCSRRVLSELLLQLNRVAEQRYVTVQDFDGCNSTDPSIGSDEDDGAVHVIPDQDKVRLIIAAATNRLSDIDPALLRRFRIQLEVGLPARRHRKKMIARHLESIAHNISHEQLYILASITQGWSGSNIEDLCQMAVKRPIHQCMGRTAELRRRAEMLGQHGGDVLEEEDALESLDAVAGEYLIGTLQALRPVTTEDFHSALKSLSGGEVYLTPPQGAKKKRSRNEHYGYESSGSSSSDDESM
jgi:vacuolar protein-sorting-associated protein 4